MNACYKTISTHETFASDHPSPLPQIIRGNNLSAWITYCANELGEGGLRCSIKRLAHSAIAVASPTIRATNQSAITSTSS